MYLYHVISFTAHIHVEFPSKKYEFLHVQLYMSIGTTDTTGQQIPLLKSLFFFLLFFGQLSDDEALIMLLQTSLFLVFPYAVDS